MDSKPTILLVDDSVISRRLFRRILEKEECYNLVDARDAGEALTRMRGTPEVDVVLLDVNLPDQQGTEVCRQIKRNPATEDTRVILVSASSTDDRSIAAGMDAGCDGYLIQPVESTRLRAWVRAAVRMRRVSREAAQERGVAAQGHQALFEHVSRLGHGVNNPLQSLVATIDLLSIDLQHDEKALESLNAVLGYAEDVARLVDEASQMAKQHLADDPE